MDYVEHFDPPEEFNAKIKQLAVWIRQSQHMIAFTGAGISTTCGIPDFRSGMNTVLSTGAGAWTLKAAGAPRTAKTTSTLKAIPSLCHMSLLTLMERGTLKYVVSQNTVRCFAPPSIGFSFLISSFYFYLLDACRLSSICVWG